MMLGVSSLSLFSLALPSAHTAPSTLFSLPFLCLRRQPSCWSRLAALEYWAVWQHLGRGVPGHYQTHPPWGTHTQFAKYSRSHNPLLLFTWATHPRIHCLWFQDKEIWLAWGLGLCSSPFTELCECVCWCVKRMLMWVGSWSSGSDWRWQSRGHTVWASRASSTDGRRERETESSRQRQKERAAIHRPVSLLTSFSIRTPQIQLPLWNQLLWVLIPFQAAAPLEAH